MYSSCTVLLWVLLLRSSSLRHIRTCYSDDATANIADRRCYRRPQTSISYSVSEKRLLVLIYCECECLEFKENVCNVEQNTAGCRSTPTPKPSLLLPATIDDAARCLCCRLPLSVVAVATTTTCCGRCCLVPAARVAVAASVTCRLNNPR